MRHFVVGTSGHIDHGKSTLVRVLTGTDPDRLKEEKARGITIDLGFAHYTDDELVISFVDVPGHERFVKNMLAGATGMDAVLLVVAADESVMPQTREHFAIARLLGVARGIVVLTKVDLVETDMVDLVRLEVRELVSGSFLEDAPIVAVSARTGDGLDELRAALRGLAARAPRRPLGGAFRLPIDRVFSVRGFGTVVTGTVGSGIIAAEDEVESVLQHRRIKVRGVQVHGAKRERAEAGQRAALNLGGVDVDVLHRGDTLATPGAFRSTRRFDGTLELLGDIRPLKHGARVRVHQGTREMLGRVAICRGLEDSDATPGESATARAEVPAGGRAYVRVRLEGTAVLARGDHYVLRSYSPSTTIAGGVVLDPDPPRNATRGAAQLRRLLALDPAGRSIEDGDVAARAATVSLEEAAERGVTRAALQLRWSWDDDRARAVMRRLVDQGDAVATADGMVASAAVNRLERAVLAALARHHADEPLSEGMPREEVRTRVCAGAPIGVFEVVVARLTAQQRLLDRDRLALASHKVAVAESDVGVMTRVAAAYETAGLKPPDRAALEAAVGGPSSAIDRVVQMLARQKVLVKLEGLWFHQSALERLKADVRGLKTPDGRATVDVATFKERYGMSRKYAIPLLEYLDRERVTRRVGESRVII